MVIMWKLQGEKRQWERNVGGKSLVKESRVK